MVFTAIRAVNTLKEKGLDEAAVVREYFMEGLQPELSLKEWPEF